MASPQYGRREHPQGIKRTPLNGAAKAGWWCAPLRREDHLTTERSVARGYCGLTRSTIVTSKEGRLSVAGIVRYSHTSATAGEARGDNGWRGGRT